MKKLLFAILTLLAMSACSTTAKLAEGDVLYTGVKKLDVTAADSVKIPSGISDNIGEIIDVPANNSWYSPYVQGRLCRTDTLPESASLHGSFHRS